REKTQNVVGIARIMGRALAAISPRFPSQRRVDIQQKSGYLSDVFPDRPRIRGTLDVTDRAAFLSLADRHDICDIAHLARRRNSGGESGGGVKEGGESSGGVKEGGESSGGVKEGGESGGG
ncbi:hypothetical protein HH310_25610, partial [Actinoplanes sp. TBRC 11911]|uniref:hypothetical protein n=1 Tax=Actinoplanes sp. TBRC 11911 TaxID=2729386 RepID=UPI00145E6086